MTTREQAEEVLDKVVKSWEEADEQYGPKILEDWDGRDFVIAWEGGPHEWTYSTHLYNTDKVWCEPVNNVVLALYPKDDEPVGHWRDIVED